MCHTLFSIKPLDANLPFSPAPPPPPPVPMWAVGAIVVVVLALVACLGFCIFKKCFNKGSKPKKVRERKGGRGRRKKDKDGEDGGDKVRRGRKVEGESHGDPVTVVSAEGQKIHFHPSIIYTALLIKGCRGG